MACHPHSHMNDPEQRLLVNLENSCNVKSAEAIVAVSAGLLTTDAITATSLSSQPRGLGC